MKPPTLPNFQRHLIGVVGLLAVILTGAPARAASPFAPGELRYTTWLTNHGLPSNKVNDILQTRDGFIWIATFDGLARFDGEKFTVFNESNTEGLHDHSLTCLYEGKDGVLLIGHTGGAVTRYTDGEFSTILPRNSQPPGITKSIAIDGAGDIWTYGDAGLLVRLKDGLALNPESGVAHLLVALANSAEGKIWVSNAGLLSVLEGDRLRLIPLDAPDTFVQGICASQDGGLWVASGNRIRKYRDGKWDEISIPLALAGAALHVFKETARGELIAGSSEHGLYLIPNRPGEAIQQLSRANGFPSDWVLALCEDREGGIWVGTGGAGLVTVHRTQVSTPAPPDGWGNRAVLSVSPASAGGLWIGTEGAGLYRFHAGRWDNYSLGAGIRNPYVWSVLEDRHGTLWAGTWSNGVYKKVGENFLRAPGVDRMNIPMPAISEAALGGLWFGTSEGLLRYEEGRVAWAEPEEESRLRDIRAIVEAEDGTVWFGSNGGGLGQWHNGKTKHFHKADGLPGEFIQCLRLDRAGALWIGTSGAGLVRYQSGKFVPINIEQGLLNTVICDIEEDDKGHFWLSSHSGLLRVSKAELDRCADGLQTSVECLSYGLSDGMPSLDFSGGMQPAGCKLPDGRLAFGTSKGLVIIDPARIEINPVVPPVAIVGLLVDGRDIPVKLGSGARVIIPPGSHRLEFRYAGLSFAAPEKVRFKRRLIGLEADWVPAGSKRSADYTYLPPGSYVFQVTACNNDGVWNETGARLTVTVQPFFWQTLWFKLLALALLIVATGLLVWFETRRRLQQKLAILDQKRAIANERARIASDMHDDLGSQLTQITMLSETARSGLKDTSVAGKNLTQIYDTARGLTRAMDEIVWAVNSKHDTMESLVTYLEKFALDFLGSAGIRCRLELPLEYPAWTPSSEVRHNLFLAFKEALNNAAKHAGATVVLIALEVSESDYRLTVQDDGRGFDPAGHPVVSDAPDRIASGNGLENMRRRMARISGQCEISSAVGSGTKVTLVAPATPPLS